MTINCSQSLSGWWVASDIVDGYLVTAKGDTRQGAISALRDKIRNNQPKKTKTHGR